MRPELASGLVGLVWVGAIAILGLVIPSPVGRLTFFVLAVIVAAVLAFVAKKPTRAARVLVAVGALTCAVISYPDAAVEAERYRQRDKGKSTAVQPASPAKSDPRE